ncbi:MAG: hypothetical protein JWN41_1799 [Thermoleophilia bacterium]|nr:hypothetical protein [Thermoleophilia bacterium]
MTMLVLNAADGLAGKIFTKKNILMASTVAVLGACSSGLGVAAHGMVQDFVGPQDADHPLRSTAKAPWAQALPTLSGVALLATSAAGYRSIGKTNAKAAMVQRIMDAHRDRMGTGLATAAEAPFQAGSRELRMTSSLASAGRKLGRFGLMIGMAGGFGIALGAAGGGSAVSDTLNGAGQLGTKLLHLPTLPQLDFHLPDIGKMTEDAFTVSSGDKHEKKTIELDRREPHDVLDLVRPSDGSKIKITESVPFKGATTINEFLHAGVTNKQTVAEHNKAAHEQVVDPLNPKK